MEIHVRERGEGGVDVAGVRDDRIDHRQVYQRQVVMELTGDVVRVYDDVIGQVDPLRIVVRVAHDQEQCPGLHDVRGRQHPVGIEGDDAPEPGTGKGVADRGVGVAGVHRAHGDRVDVGAQCQTACRAADKFLHTCPRAPGGG
jgi:hypothetical protein